MCMAGGSPAVGGDAVCGVWCVGCGVCGVPVFQVWEGQVAWESSVRNLQWKTSGDVG